MSLYRPTPGFKGRTFKLCVLTRWDFNFCVRSSPLRGSRKRFRSDHHVTLCRRVECTLIGAWFQPSKERGLPHLVADGTSLLATVNVRCYLFWRYCQESTTSLVLLLIHNFFHVPYPDTWALPWFALLERVQQFCIELFHAFSPGKLNGSVTQLNRKQLFIQGHGSATAWIRQWRKHGGRSLSFSRGLLLVMFWLAEAVLVISSSESTVQSLLKQLCSGCVQSHVLLISQELQFSCFPWTIRSSGGHVGRFSSDPLSVFFFFCKRPLWVVLAWVGMSTLWSCPSSISSADHSVAHTLKCPEG